MTDKRDNINDRGNNRIEPTNDIKNQLLDVAPEPSVKVDGGPESRASLLDQVPGHNGYNKHDNLITANVSLNSDDLDGSIDDGIDEADL
jgi:hypothetical protein